MSDLLAGDISSVAEFLAHALEMEVESAERYRELADNMEVHHNPEVADLFRRLAVEGDAHVEQVMQHGATIELPNIAPWAFKWSSPDGPESPAMDDVHYLMTRRQALELALHNEVRGLDFYNQVAERSRNADVRRLASKMTSEEEAHVAMLRSWLIRESDEGSSSPLADLDPPNMPE
jgi:rubrerythrin